MLAFFFSPEKEHPLRTTLMTSSKRHWGQRAVSHLVLYTNLKKRQSNRDTRGRGSRGEITSERNKDVNSEEAVQVMVLGLNWPTHLGCCEVHPWVGGGIWWVMVWAHRLSENSLCRSMFVCEVESLSPSPAGPPLSQSAGSHLVSPDFHVREPPTGILSSVSWLALVWSGLGEEADSNVPSSLAGC